MSTLKTNIADIAFPWEVDVIEIASGETERQCAVRILCGGQTALDVLCDFDTSGLISLYDVAELFESYMDEQVRNCEMFLDGQRVKAWTMIPCRVETDVPASTWVNDNMLSMLRGEKLTVADAVEYFSWYGGGSSASISVCWIAGDTVAYTSTSVSSVGTGVHTAYVNLASLTPPSEGAVMASVTVTVGSRKMKWLVATPENPPVHVRFLNCFGCMESIVLLGVAERELKPERSSVQSKGRHKVYKVQSVPTWKVGTGSIPDGMVGIFDDLVRAKQLYLVEGSHETELAIVDSDWSYSTSPDTMPSGSVTWRLASKMQYRKMASSAAGIFDQTFDETFN